MEDLSKYLSIDLGAASRCSFCKGKGYSEIQDRQRIYDMSDYYRKDPVETIYGPKYPMLCSCQAAVPEGIQMTFDKTNYVADPDSGALKGDYGKLRYDLIPVYALEELTRVFSYGSVKYADRNWEKGLQWNRPFAASMRHMWAWWRGEDLDPESGISHLAHAACNIMFLLQYTKDKQDFDDRPKETR